MRTFQFKKFCYEKYRLDWMLSHGYSLTSLIKKLNKNYNEFAYDNCYEYKPSNAFADFEDTDGFGSGILWASFDEFCETEFKDKTYIEELLSRYPRPFESKKEAIQEYNKHKNK